MRSLRDANVRHVLESVYWRRFVQVLVAAGLVFTFASGSYTNATNAVLVVYMAAMAMTMTLPLGYAKLFVFGHQAVIGVGAYTYSLLAIYAGISPWLALVAGVIFGAAVGAVLGAVSTRLVGFAFGLVSLALALVFVAWVDTYSDLTGGSSGLAGMPSLFPGAVTAQAQLVVALVVLAVVSVIIQLAGSGAWGRVMIVLGGDPFLARSIGLSVVSTRVAVLAVGSALGALVGAFFAQYLLVISPGEFSFSLLITLMLIMYLGGSWSVWGLLFASLIVEGIPLAINLPSSWGEIGAGVLFAVILITLPHGLYPRLRRPLRHALLRGSAGPERRPDAGTRQPSLAGEGLVKDYGGVRALNDVSIEARSGEILAIIGSNGSGKTTFLNCVCGYVAPDSGTILLAGRHADHHLHKLDIARIARAEVGRSFQVPRLSEDLSVFDNVLVGAESAHGRRTSSAQIARRCIENWGLESLLGADIRTMSHGLRRLVELARLEAGEFTVILLDEPVAGLTVEEQGLVRAGLARWRDANRILVVVEHNMHFVQSTADRVVMMEGGRVIIAGDTEFVFHSQEFQHSIVGEVDRLEDELVEGDEPPPEQLPHPSAGVQR